MNLLSVIQKGNLNNFTSQGPEGIGDVVAKPLSIVFEKPWQSREVPSDLRNGNITLIFKKRNEEDPGSYQAVSL